MKMQLDDPEYCDELKPSLSFMIIKEEVGGRKHLERVKEKGILIFFPVFFN